MVMCSFIVFFERLIYFSINNIHFECFVMLRKTVLINDKYSEDCQRRGRARRDSHVSDDAAVLRPTSQPLTVIFLYK